ncbi:hypothetical protein N8628_04250 [Verrucomicrobia bacterium]|nr:hypothetical protein [Verrucomicrobiota bacterium]
MKKAKNIFVDPGILNLKQLSAKLKRFYNVKYITQNICRGGQSEYNYKNKKKEFSEKLLPPYPKLGNNHFINKSYKESDYITGKIIDDHQTLLMYDRCENYFFTSDSLKVLKIIDKIDNSINWIKKFSPDWLIFMATPHHIDTWIFARVAEELGVKIAYFDESIIPWRYFVFTGLKYNRKPILNLGDETSSEENIRTKSYFKNKKSSIDKALPPYQIKKYKKISEKIYNLQAEILSNWYRPDIVIYKHLCYKALRKYDVKISERPSNYALFFLHYQPERTTLPEGFGYAQQYRAIKLLRQCLPQHIKIYVKEHPSTYKDRCDFRERSPAYYKSIASIENTELLNIDTDTYKLIDNAFCVATIKGLVAAEAYIRNTPAIVFSNLWLPFCDKKLVHVFNNYESLKRFCETIVEHGESVYERSLSDYVKKLEQHTIRGDNNESEPNYNSDLFFKERNDAITNGIYKLIKSINNGTSTFVKDN